MLTHTHNSYTWASQKLVRKKVFYFLLTFPLDTNKTMTCAHTQRFARMQNPNRFVLHLKHVCLSTLVVFILLFFYCFCFHFILFYFCNDCQGCQIVLFANERQSVYQMSCVVHAQPLLVAYFLHIYWRLQIVFVSTYVSMYVRPTMCVTKINLG